MKVLEGFLQLLCVALAMALAYFSTTTLLNVNMTLVDLLLGLSTYGVYLFAAAAAADGIAKWFKKVHWDIVEEQDKGKVKT